MIPSLLAVLGIALATPPLPGFPAPADTMRLRRAPGNAIIAVRVDPGAAGPVLNITAAGDAAVRRVPMRFTGYANYQAWISRYELRIFADSQSTQGMPLAVIAPAGRMPEFTWNAGVPGSVGAVRYLLRVYAADGAFDETAPQYLPVVDRARPVPADTTSARNLLAGYGENRRAVANIAMSGAAVTVTGDSIAAGAVVTVMDVPVPVDPAGRFAVRQILPAGQHTVVVTIANPDGVTTEYTRVVDVPRRDWFSVGIVDLTLGHGSLGDPAAPLAADVDRRRDGTWADGRAAFYLKGQLADHLQLTASADTREQPLSDLFSQFSRRDPLSLLRRLDPNTGYQLYGDDGTLVEDAPTQGNLYLRLQRNDSHLMWGSFQTEMPGTDLVSFSRGLYGGQLLHRSLTTTTQGERRLELTGFAADPGTVGAREEFRGTGGSLYYLQQQDVLMGSERIRVEVRDRESAIVFQSTTLQPGQDYELNALQGRVTLKSPLGAVADGSSLVRTGALDGNPAYLVVTYEYTPGLSRARNLTTGGRASYWVNDHLRIGTTGYRQRGSDIQQDLAGGDFTWRYRPGAYLTVERAYAEGKGAPVFASLDGGFGFHRLSRTDGDSISAYATRAELALDLRELTGGARQGNVRAYWIDRDAGFSAPGQLAGEGMQQRGVAADLDLTRALAMHLKADLRDGVTAGQERAVELGAGMALTNDLALRFAARNDHRETGIAGGASALLREVGDRTDVAGRLTWGPMTSDSTHGRYQVYGLAQATVHRDGDRTANDRFGVGGQYRVSDRVLMKGEATDGDGGQGGLIGTDYRVTDRSSLYLNYLVDVDRSDQGYRGRTGTLTTGGQWRYSDASSVFAERRQFTSEASGSGVTHAFGLDLSPTDRWNWGIRLEAGTLSDSATGDVSRRAASVSAGYNASRTRLASVLEYRTDRGELSGLRESWLMKNTFGYQASDDWRALGRVNLAVSSGTGTIGDAKYTEVVAGLAYRPARDDRFNGLLQYTWLYDLASPGQLGAGLQYNPFAQRSHVFSADGIMAVSTRLSLGAKVGYRTGEIRDNSVTDAPWTGSAALLTIARADWHVIHEWDAVAELRSLTVREAHDARRGILLGVYRHLGGNVKIGLGYNFTDYSDDLTDLSFRSRGLFLNLVGQR